MRGSSSPGRTKTLLVRASSSVGDLLTFICEAGKWTEVLDRLDRLDCLVTGSKGPRVSREPQPWTPRVRRGIKVNPFFLSIENFPSFSSRKSQKRLK